jgi:hypothetical protein
MMWHVALVNWQFAGLRGSETVSTPQLQRNFKLSEKLKQLIKTNQNSKTFIIIQATRTDLLHIQQWTTGPWRWKLYASPKWWQVLTSWHGTTSQKTSSATRMIRKPQNFARQYLICNMLQEYKTKYLGVPVRLLVHLPSFINWEECPNIAYSQMIKQRYHPQALLQTDHHTSNKYRNERKNLIRWRTTCTITVN